MLFISKSTVVTKIKGKTIAQYMVIKQTITHIKWFSLFLRCMRSFVVRRYMAEILPIRPNTLYKHSINRFELNSKNRSSSYVNLPHTSSKGNKNSIGHINQPTNIIIRIFPMVYTSHSVYFSLQRCND